MIEFDSNGQSVVGIIKHTSIFRTCLFMSTNVGALLPIIEVVRHVYKMNPVGEPILAGVNGHPAWHKPLACTG